MVRLVPDIVVVLMRRWISLCPSLRQMWPPSPTRMTDCTYLPTSRSALQRPLWVDPDTNGGVVVHLVRILRTKIAQPCVAREGVATRGVVVLKRYFVRTQYSFENDVRVFH